MGVSNEKAKRMDRIANWPIEDRINMALKIHMLKDEYGLTYTAIAERFGVNVWVIRRMAEQWK